MHPFFSFRGFPSSLRTHVYILGPVFPLVSSLTPWNSPLAQHMHHQTFAQAAAQSGTLLLPIFPIYFKASIFPPQVP